MCKILFLALAIFLFSGSQCMADDIGRKIQDAYSKISSFEATFEQKLRHRESDTVETRKGKLLFQKPLSIRWVTEKPHEEVIVVNAREIWNYLPDEDLAYIYPPDAIGDANGIIPVVTGQARLHEDFDVKSAGKEGGLAKILLLPKSPTPQLVEATIWVDEKSGLIRRAAIKDFYGNGNEVRFLSFKPGVKVSQGQFNFKAPAGVEVEDRRKNGL